MRELFIYYAVDPAQAGALREALAAWHRALRAEHPGLIARVLVRSDAPGARQTWMETYSTRPELLPDGIDAALQARIEADARARLLPLIAGDRHVEVFRACAW